MDKGDARPNKPGATAHLGGMMLAGLYVYLKQQSEGCSMYVGMKISAGKWAVFIVASDASTCVVVGPRMGRSFAPMSTGQSSEILWSPL
jgi:hypothetical protein